MATLGATFDQEMSRAIAAHAGLALERAEMRRNNERLRLIEGRAGIAEDLRHPVIQRLFAFGPALQGAASRTTKPVVRATNDAQIEEVDRGYPGAPSRGVLPRPAPTVTRGEAEPT